MLCIVCVALLLTCSKVQHWSSAIRITHGWNFHVAQLDKS